MSTVQQDDLAERVKFEIAILAGVAVSQVRDDANLVDDLDCDSLDVIEIVMAAEDQFDIEIDDETAFGLKTVQQVIDCVRSRI